MSFLALLRPMQSLRPASVAPDSDISTPRNLAPTVLVPLMVALGLGMVGSLTEWVNLTIAGIGMGMIIFMASSGLTLVFGLMKVMNFGHAIFFTLGAFVGALLLAPNAFLMTYFGFWVDNIVVNILSLLVSGFLGLIAYWYAANDWWLNLCGLLVAAAMTMGVCVLIGLVFERAIIRPAGRVTINQVMMTVAGMVIMTELMIALFGHGTRIRAMPGFKSSFIFGDIAIEKFRLLMIALGLLTWGGLHCLLHRTRFGILVRATVENREQVEALGYRTRRVMLAMFSLGVALAALGGLIWGIYQNTIGIRFGGTLLPLMFMVLMIGGLGSITGSLIAALMLGLLTNYVGYAYPLFTAFSSIVLTLAIVSWRPKGLYPMELA